ncbi:hypothetical protein PHLGIDRAFT_115825 [Phlebiopsis gigantea 11061_1 CR5-6]|uniref:J domain-containing protein n=1 Tax=Phlebiopsis gigantea (strain 11061_1 CR5-6) TaxID=745531 RepID=A0A0C3PRS4_PHLG1|nr:hypothetical protein PHLGIDRAFT_115825 [Phlebiopsis gigantea 11061_1 CR5-6]
MGLLPYHPSLYDILDVPQTAAPDTVRKAYKRLLLETHPDKLPVDATEDDKAAAEERFREVYQAFEILSDTAKRRVYDNGLSFLHRRTRMDEVQARIAREREEWDRQTKLKQEERLQMIRERMKERQERERHMKEVSRRELEAQTGEYEQKRRALEEQLRNAKEREREILKRAEEKVQEKMKVLQNSVQVSRVESARNPKLLRRLSTSTTSTRSSRSSVSAHTLAALSVVLKADDLLCVLRLANPDLEARRQAALHRKAERLSSYGGSSILSAA